MHKVFRKYKHKVCLVVRLPERPVYYKPHRKCQVCKILFSKVNAIKQGRITVTVITNSINWVTSLILENVLHKLSHFPFIRQWHVFIGDFQINNKMLVKKKLDSNKAMAGFIRDFKTNICKLYNAVVVLFANVLFLKHLVS